MTDKDQASQEKSTGAQEMRKAKVAAPSPIEARFQAIFESSREAIGVTKAGIHLVVNPAYLELFGFPRGTDLAGKPVLDLIAPVSRDQVKAQILHRVRGEPAPATCESRGLRIDGSEFEMEVHVSLYQENGEDHALVILRDINVRQQSESALKQSEARYRLLYNETPVLLHSIDRDARVVDVNDYWLMIMGYERSEVIGRKVTDFFTAESRKYAEETVLPAFFRDGSVKNIAYQFVRKNGEVVDVLLSATAERDAAGTVLRSLSVVTDVTERKRAEAALRESEQRFKAITMTASDAILLMDDRGRLVHWNPAAERMFGHTAEEALGKDLHLFLAPQRLHQDYLQGFETFVKTGQGPVINRAMEMVAIKKDGTEFPIEVSTSAMNISGKWHALGIVRDITQRKRAEAALRENQARLDLALQSAHMGIWRWEIKENGYYFDDQACQLLGIEAASFNKTAAEFFQVVHPGDREKIKAALARTLEHDLLYEPTFPVVWPDGNIHYIAARGRLVRDDKERPVRINGVLWDVTNERLLEQERIKTQKLESVGTLAGGIAHDFNNLLQGAFGYISLARLTHDQKEKSLAMLEQAEKALHQSVNLASQLLTFSKGGKPVKRIIDLRPLIENSVAFALSGSRNIAEIITDEDLRMVEADEGQIGQVVQNIVLNADQAMPLGGKIRVSVRNGSAAAIVPPADLQGDLVECSISDQGTGIPAAYLTRIFDPYFTTKKEGSGLGLATSYSIIKNHGGLIRVRSEVGKGTTFSVYLPASGAPSEKAKSPEILTPTRKGKILIMDDEKMIGTVAGELLTIIGHESAYAENGETALEAYRAARDAGRPFDLVILDLTVRGGMGGIETLRKLVAIDPGVQAVVSSGYSDDAVLSNYREQGFRAFLKKPYRMEELQSLVKALLG